MIYLGGGSMKQPFTNLIVDEGDVELLHYAIAEFMDVASEQVESGKMPAPKDWDNIQERAIQMQYYLNQKIVELQGFDDTSTNVSGGFGIENIEPEEFEGGK